MSFNGFGKNDQSFHILIVGSGVVGTATGKGFAKRGHRISYVDVNRERIQQLNAEGMQAMTAAEVDWQDVDIVMLTVSTPSRNGRILLSHIESAALDVGQGLATTDKFVTVVVRSTVPPTTTEQRIAPIIAKASGKKVGEGFGIAMNPEFLRQVSAVKDFDRPWITVLGTLDQRTANLLNRVVP